MQNDVENGSDPDDSSSSGSPSSSSSSGSSSSGSSSDGKAQIDAESEDEIGDYEALLSEINAEIDAEEAYGDSDNLAETGSTTNTGEALTNLA